VDIADQMKEAASNGSAMAAFNAPGFETMLAISKAGSDLDRPVIVQTSSRLVKQHSPQVLFGWFELARRQTGARTYLHLDHCNDHELIRDCISSGWDMVMFDGSHLSIDENVEQCSHISEFAREFGVAVEGEVGAIGGEEDGFEADANYASDQEIERLAHEAGIDCIAVGFGNVHGDYSTKSNLRWDIYERSRDLGGLPLVLHGGSGLTDAEFDRAIKAGTAKINISTELKKAYAAVVADAEVRGRLSSSPSALHDALFERCYDVAFNYIAKFETGGDCAT